MTGSTSMAAPWGILTLFWERRRLLRVTLSPERDLTGNKVEDRPPREGLANAAYLWLRGFLGGEERRPFPQLEELLEEAGMFGFKRRVMEEAARIGFGETRSYSQLALDAGYPRAARAVGRAMSANPFPLLVPCHRVVSASGELGGYRWGTNLKERLLSWERDLLK